MKSIREWKAEKIEEEIGLDGELIQAVNEDLKTALRQLMGGDSTIKMPQDIRSMLRDDIIRISAKYSDLPKGMLIRLIMGTAASLLGDIKGSNITIQSLGNVMGDM